MENLVERLRKTCLRAIAGSKEIVEFMPNGPIVKAAIRRYEHTGKIIENESLYDGVITCDTQSLKPFTHVKYKNAEVYPIQHVEEREGYTITKVRVF